LIQTADRWKRKALGLVPSFDSVVVSLPGFAKRAAKQTAQQNSMQNAAANRARYEEVTDKKSPDRLLLVILRFSFCRGPVADDTDDSGFKGFVECSQNLIHFVLSDELSTFLL
jgi:hypothetical protein